MLEGQLPWKSHNNPYLVALNKKNFCCAHKLPTSFQGLDDHLNSLAFEDSPDYSMLRSMFLEALERLEVGQLDPFDWEKEVAVSPAEPGPLYSTTVDSEVSSILSTSHIRAFSPIL